MDRARTANRDGVGTILQEGRRKAYRPLARPERDAALAEALAAYERGDFFAAHELLEPAWMGTDDLLERALHQGLIKLAAAFVHHVRGNPVGVAKNLLGARHWLVVVVDGNGATGGLEVPLLVADIDRLLEQLEREPTAPIDPPRLRRVTA